jgi:nitrous oxide reductase
MRVKEKDRIGRREFLSRATLAALTLPAVLQGGSKTGHAQSEQSATAVPEKGETKIKKIGTEEH